MVHWYLKLSLQVMSLANNDRTVNLPGDASRMLSYFEGL